MRPAICSAASAESVYFAALEYAALGLSVLPCRGKLPAVTWSAFQQRRADRLTIARWHDVGLLDNVGIVCGKVSGNLVVIDLDGDDAVAAFQDRFDYLTDTFSVKSGGGHGMHLYYTCTDLPRTARVTGVSIGNVELRADGCYVIAPPSIHLRGAPYTIAHEAGIMPFADLRPVVTWIRLLARHQRESKLPRVRSLEVADATTYGKAALRSEAEEVRHALPGERNNRLYRAALKMGSLIADGALDRASVERDLLDAAAALTRSDGGAATLRTIRSGIDKGLESPRERYRDQS